MILSIGDNPKALISPPSFGIKILANLLYIIQTEVMDELFDRIKLIKIKRRTLAIFLILTELLGILVLVWFLRVPLSQKFLTNPPKAYSVDSFDSQKTYAINQADFLRGSADPKSKVVAIMR